MLTEAATVSDLGLPPAAAVTRIDLKALELLSNVESHF